MKSKTKSIGFNILIVFFLISIFILAPYSVSGNPYVSEEALRAQDEMIEAGRTSRLMEAFGFGDKLKLSAGEAGYDDINNPNIVIGTVIEMSLSLLGIIFIILIIYGGYQWMYAKGNEEQVKKAKEIIMAAIIGLVIVVAAYAISYFVISSFSEGVLEELSTN